MATNTAPASPPVRRNPRQVVNTLRKTVNYDDADVALAELANSLPLGAFIVDAFVEVVTAFNGTSPTMVVGTNASTYDDIVASGDVDLTTAAVYRVATGRGRSVAASAEKPVFAKTTLSSATQGQAVILIQYDGGWST